MTAGVDRVGSRGNAETSRRRPLRRWSIGHLAVALAAVLAFVANLAVLRSADEAVAVVSAARPIEAGEVVELSDLTTTRVSAEAGVLATLLTSVEGLEGRVARRPLVEGELVGAGDLLTAAAPSGLASMAIPIEPAHAAGGTIRPGDRVDVIDVDDGGARYVVRDVPVLAAPDSGSGALTSASGSHMVIGLAGDDVLAVATAIADGRVDVVVTTGASGG